MALQRNTERATDSKREAQSGSNVVEFDFFLKRTGLYKSWIARQLGLTTTTFDNSIMNGFRPDLAALLQNTIQANGKRLLRFQFSQDQGSDIGRLRSHFGIKKVFFANALQMPKSSFYSILNRAAGLRESELRIVEIALGSSAREQISFHVSKNFIRNAA